MSINQAQPVYLAQQPNISQAPQMQSRGRQGASSSSIQIEAKGQGENIFANLFSIGKTQKKDTKMNNLYTILLVFVIIVLCFLIYINIDKIKEFIDKLFNIESDEYSEYEEEQDEVFNVLDNSYTYDDADKVCDLINGSKLASYEQVLDAYNNGAEWCNYGWSKDGLALYPMQTQKDDCGDKGVNGGYFDKKLKFGVNCYGKKPTESNFNSNYNLNTISNIKKDENTDDVTELIDTKQADLMGFNNTNWSMYT